MSLGSHLQAVVLAVVGAGGGSARQSCCRWSWRRWSGALHPQSHAQPNQPRTPPCQNTKPEAQKEALLGVASIQSNERRWCVAYPSWCPGLTGESSPAGFGGGGGRYRLPPASAPPADCLGESESGECDSSSGSGSGDLRLCALAVRAALGLRAGGELELTDRNRRRRACRSDSVVASPTQQCQMSLQFFCCSVGTLSKPLCKPCRTEPEFTAPQERL